jgi:hypothetical protein
MGKQNQVMVISPSGMKIHKDNPFKDEIEKYFSNTAETNNQLEFNGENTLVKESITVTRTRTYQKGVHWVKLTQNREKLENLSPYACKILLYIALNIAQETQIIRIPAKNLTMGRKTFDKAILEMMLAGILKREKREHYWINITLLIIGKIDMTSMK